MVPDDETSASSGVYIAGGGVAVGASNVFVGVAGLAPQRLRENEPSVNQTSTPDQAVDNALTLMMFSPISISLK